MKMNENKRIKTIRTAALALAVLTAALAFASCSARQPGLSSFNDMSGGYPAENMQNGRAGIIAEYFVPDNSGAVKTVEKHYEPGDVVENPFIETEKEAVSTFSADVDTASYTYFRKLVKAGYTLSELKATGGAALRTEEMVNYFSYDCPAPDGKLFGVKATVAPCPYNEATKLLKLTIGTEKAEPSQKNNLVFLIDVSGSMNSEDKLPLLKKTFSALTDRLDGDDVVSIVTYAGREAVVLDGCSGAKKETILNAVNSLSSSGSTNGEAGLKTAYALAEKHFIPDGNNRIFLASDGDLNVGISSAEELKTFVEGKRDGGVFLSVLGFGTGNYKDENMEALADNGNGVYCYIDGEEEAEKIFGGDLFKSLYTVAKDVKLQLTFNADAVKSYRLIGYENRILDNRDFENDAKDAGDVGAGAQVTVFYELILNENAQSADAAFAQLSVRFKEPDGFKSAEETYPIAASAYTDDPDDDFVFAAAVVECSLLLHDSVFKGQAAGAHLKDRLAGLDLSGDEYKNAFRSMVNGLF